jgi:hypothetical protein
MLSRRLSICIFIIMPYPFAILHDRERAAHIDGSKLSGAAGKIGDGPGVKHLFARLVEFVQRVGSALTNGAVATPPASRGPGRRPKAVQRTFASLSLELLHALNVAASSATICVGIFIS